MTFNLLTLMHVAGDRLRAGVLKLRGVALGRKIRVGPRCRITRLRGVRIGQRSWLEADVWLKLESPDAQVEIGEHVFLARNCTVNALANISIGSHSLFGPNCMIVDHNHGMASGRRIDEQACERRPVCIGQDVWCGAGTVILPGVTIGDGAVIGANAVVSKDIPPMTVAVGNPARVIRRRKEAEQGE